MGFPSTLEELCLNLIKREFERFCLAWRSDDAILQRQLEFLKRVYSDEIAGSICIFMLRDEKIPTHYTEFLINKYLKFIDTDWLKDCSWETITEKFAEMGSNLKKIYFGEGLKEMPWQDILSYLPNLETASFNSGFCNDEILKSMGKFCPNIVKLDISSCRDVSDESIKYLCEKENGVISCPKLKYLFINDCEVTVSGVERLIKNTRSLEIISYHKLPDVLYSLHKNDLSVLEKLEPYNITSLNLLYRRYVSHYTDMFKICLSLCPRLVSLYCSILEEHQLDFLVSPNVLEYLNLLILKCSMSSKVDISNLLKLKGSKLTSLLLENGALSVSTLAKSCPRLRFLLLDNVNFLHNCELPPLRKHLDECDFIYDQNNSDIPATFEQLEVCVFWHYRDSATAQSISFLLRSALVLRRVTFQGCDISANELKAGILICCKQSTIELIRFNHCVVEMSFVKDMLRNSHSSVRRFRLYKCTLDSEEKVELDRFARELPNAPRIMFN